MSVCHAIPASWAGIEAKIEHKRADGLKVSNNYKTRTRFSKK